MLDEKLNLHQLKHNDMQISCLKMWRNVTGQLELGIIMSFYGLSKKKTA